jgi:hypothetical protein
MLRFFFAVNSIVNYFNCLPVMKTKTIFFLLSSFGFSIPAIGQYFYNNDFYDNAFSCEIGGSVGIMNCLTDVGGKKGNGKRFIKDLDWRCSRPCAGIYFSAIYQYTIGARLEFCFGRVTGADSSLRNDESPARNRYLRNLNFSSNIIEGVLMVEFYPLSLIAGSESASFSPYILAGFGIFHFKPYTSFNGEKIYLHDLHTEGEGFREYSDRQGYQLTQVNYPIGFGVKYEASAIVNFRLEIIHRILQTDYLDDVSTDYIDPAIFHKYLPPGEASLAEQLADRRREIDPAGNLNFGQQRGNPANNDCYFSVNLKLGFVINRRKRG